MLTYNLDERGGIPIYEFLYQRLRDDISRGVPGPGKRLPSRRMLAEHLGVSVITVENAYRQLEAEGYISIQPRRGAYVSADMIPQASLVKGGWREAPGGFLSGPGGGAEAPRKWTLDLSGNHVDPSGFPAATWARLARRILSEKQNALLEPIPHQGLPEPRRAIADYLRAFKGMNIRPEQVVIGAGAEYLYLLIAQLLGPEKIFALEDPGYPKISMVYRKCGAGQVLIPADEQGMNIDILSKSHAAAAHLSPAYHYPTGAVTPIGRRRALLKWAETSGAYLIEDDFDSEFYAAGRPIPTLQSIDRAGRVLYLNTFSQTISPAMRIGYLILPPELLNIYQRELGFYACTVPALEQLILAGFLADGHFERHLSRTRKAYRIRRAEILDAFRHAAFANRARIQEQGAGPRFLLKLDTDCPDEILRARAEALGIRIKFLSDYASAPRPEFAHTLVIHCAGLDPGRLKKSMPLLEKIFI